jgi:choline dehydrogenase-like flavoprotein
VSKSTSARSYDFVIVGAGSAGCLLADRLSADGMASVLVLEAGGWDRDPLIHIPLGIGIMHERRSHDWGYDSQPEPHLDHRILEAMRGKVVGGSSSINHMSHVRGNRGDYDRWAAQGLADWSYAKVLPYFRHYERWEKGANQYRGDSGPLCVIASRADDPLFDAFIEAAESHGHRFTEDYNGERQEGVGRGQSTICRGRRHSAATAFLRPALRRPGVRLETESHVTRILFEGTRAIGVEYRRKGQTRQVWATREVILSAGVFNTPQLLMLSGIGPADHLRSLGIRPLIDSPDVGQNLQDHLGVIASATRPRPGAFQRELRFDRMTRNILQAHFFGSGPASSLPRGLNAYLRTESGLDAPDLPLIFRGVSTKPHLWFPGVRRPAPDHCGIRPILLHPQSRGQVRLRSSDPAEKVLVHQNFLSHEADIRKIRQGIRIARDLLANKALDGIRGEEVSPGPKRVSDQDLDAWIRRTALTAHHPAGTCAMGVSDAAVLDAELRVRGADQLRVVDASAMPDLVSGNINACVLMIAERASDLLLRRESEAEVPAGA